MSTHNYSLTLSNKTAKNDVSNTKTDTSEDEDATSFFSKMKSFAPVAAGTKLAKNIVGWQTSIIGRNTGNSDLQEKIDATKSMIGEGVTLAASAVAGVGAFTATSAIILLKRIKESDEFRFNREWAMIEQQEQLKRAGVSFNRSRRI